jgi:hypothetical protein
MEEHIVKILSIDMVTHNVKRFRFEKPAGYSFIPGQATDVSINSPSLKNEKRPFTFTCLNTHDYLEFTIKIYPEHRGVTNELGKLNAGDELIIRDVWGDISYKGKGVFIAGGAGITPFISILRDLQSKNQIDGNLLIFANKTQEDIILENELTCFLGGGCISILSDEKLEGYSYGYITKEFLNANIPEGTQYYYLCGPPTMMYEVLKFLSEMGIEKEKVIMDEF